MRQGRDRKVKRGFHREKRSTFKASMALILIALVIATGSRIMDARQNQGETTPSYGFQTGVLSRGLSDGETKQTLIARQSDFSPGTKIDEYKGVAVYSNGTDYMSSHGLSYSSDGYYYGYKWQCVEFVKRFYYERFGFEMPDGAGNAKYFYNPMLDQGDFNEQRGLVQYKNGGNVKPKEDDLLVFDKGYYGHVAIISGVGDDWIEVVQQNSEVSREKYELVVKDGTYTIRGEKEPAGWLRLED